MAEKKEVIELNDEDIKNINGGVLYYPEYGQTCQVRVDGVWLYGTVIARGTTHVTVQLHDSNKCVTVRKDSDDIEG